MSQANDKFQFFSPDTKDPIGKYTQPRPYTDKMGENGYPNNIQNTQTLRTRGTKHTTRGNSSSVKMG
jgi:hypothetical protein